VVFILGIADVGKMKEGVLLLANIDKSSPDPRHHFRNFPQVNIPDVPFSSGYFDEQLSEPAVFKNGDAVFVRRRTDNNVFFHMGFQSTSASGGVHSNTTLHDEVERAPESPAES
jgi:hypothetical protein